MSLSQKLSRTYFDLVYNPVYDFTTARIDRYHKLQDLCVGKLNLADGNRILCAGLGTGNEIRYIVRKNPHVSINGVDYSGKALARARQKALACHKEVELSVMDVQSLEFPEASFDKLLCIHVMDFVADKERATSEMVRVLREGGEFVITYPSAIEGAKMARSMFRDNIDQAARSGRSRMGAALKSVAQLLTAIVYLPLLARSGKKSCTREELVSLMTRLMVKEYSVEEEPVYQDFVVHGRK